MGLDPSTPQMMFVLCDAAAPAPCSRAGLLLAALAEIARPAEPSALTGRRFAGLVVLATAITGLLGLALSGSSKRS